MDVFVEVERKVRTQSHQPDLEVARIYRNVWPILEKEMLAARAYNMSRLTRNRQEGMFRDFGGFYSFSWQVDNSNPQ